MNEKTTEIEKINVALAQTMLPPDYTPSEDEEFMCAKHLEYFRKKLLQWKLSLLKESSQTLETLRHESLVAPDLNDRASLETEHAFELRTRDRYRKLISKIDEALQNIDNGDYGYCEMTGEEIPLKRLEARPITTMTIQAQEAYERGEKTRKDPRE